MCSVGEDIEDLANFSKVQDKKELKRHLSKCKKCLENSILVLQKKDPFCRKCFFEYCDHKFRSTIGKSKKLKHGDKVLLACSGGRKSAALLHMSKQALQSATAKQISFVPAIVFIDETVVAEQDARKHVPEILEQLKSVGYPVFISSLEMVYRLNDESRYYWSSSDYDSYADFPFCSEAQVKLKNCMSEMLLSAKLDFIKHLRLLLLTEIANHAGYNFVFIGDSASALACNLLSNIAFGRGSQISSDTNFYDSRYKVAICRPIREFLNKEIALYNHLHGCFYQVLPDLLTKTNDNASVQRLTESFLFNLQEKFPATIFTIFRTGGKLKMESSAEKETCILCKSRLDNLQPEPCSALEALKISENLSKISNEASETNSGVNPEFHNVQSDDSHSIVSDYNVNILQYLCHGCSIPFRHAKDGINFFPQFSQMDCVKMDRLQMKETIKEYLIDEPS